MTVSGHFLYLSQNKQTKHGDLCIQKRGNFNVSINFALVFIANYVLGEKIMHSYHLVNIQCQIYVKRGSFDV